MWIKIAVLRIFTEKTNMKDIHESFVNLRKALWKPSSNVPGMSRKQSVQVNDRYAKLYVFSIMFFFLAYLRYSGVTF